MPQFPHPNAMAIAKSGSSSLLRRGGQYQQNVDNNTISKTILNSLKEIPSTLTHQSTPFRPSNPQYSPNRAITTQPQPQPQADPNTASLTLPPPHRSSPLHQPANSPSEHRQSIFVLISKAPASPWNASFAMDKFEYDVIPRRLRSID